MRLRHTAAVLAVFAATVGAAVAARAVFSVDRELADIVQIDAQSGEAKAERTRVDVQPDS